MVIVVEDATVPSTNFNRNIHNWMKLYLQITTGDQKNFVGIGQTLNIALTFVFSNLDRYVN